MNNDFKQVLSTLFKSHPWHGVDIGERAPDVVKAYIEIVPSDSVKLELDKATGHLHVDRPQIFSSLCPTLYGFIPKTYCGSRVGDLASSKTKIKGVKGDGDPLDICVLTENVFPQGDLFVTARIIGGLRMIDKGEADEKIIAVLENDVAYGQMRDIKDVPKGVVERLCHYFLSYKRPPGETDANSTVSIEGVYGRAEAQEVIKLSVSDYEEKFGTEEDRLQMLREILMGSMASEAPAQKAPKDKKPKRKGPKSPKSPKTSKTKKAKD